MHQNTDTDIIQHQAFPAWNICDISFGASAQFFAKLYGTTTVIPEFYLKLVINQY